MNKIIIALGKLQYRLNTERMQISRERQEIEQEKAQLLELKQEIMEEQLRIRSEQKKIKITKSCLLRFQDQILFEEKKNQDSAKILSNYEQALIKQKQLLFQKEKILKEPLKKPIFNVKSLNIKKLHYEEDNSHTFSSKAKKSENEDINQSAITANFPNNSNTSRDEPFPRTSNFRKEQEIEEKIKGIEEEKQKLIEDRKKTETQITEIKQEKEMLKKDIEGIRQFSFIKAGVVPENDQNLINSDRKEIKEVEVKIESPSKNAQQNSIKKSENESFEFKPDPDFLAKCNQNMYANDARSPEKDIVPEKPNNEQTQENIPNKTEHINNAPHIEFYEYEEEKEIKSENKHIVMEDITGLNEINQSPNINSNKKSESMEKQKEGENKGELVFNNKNEENDEDSSDESSIFKDNKLFDEPRRAKYGIKPVISK